MSRRFRHDLFSALGQLHGYADFLAEDFASLSPAPAAAETLKECTAAWIVSARQWEQEPANQTLFFLRESQTRIVELTSLLASLHAIPDAPLGDLKKFALALAKAQKVLQEDKPEDPPLTSSSQARPRVSEKGTILIIDDSPQDRELARRLCEAEGHVVVEVATIREGLARALSDNFDAILLDWELPEGGGQAFLQNYPLVHGRAPVLLISATCDHGVFIEAMRKGTTDFLRKPYHPEEFMVRLESALRFKKYEDRQSRTLTRLQKEEARSRQLLRNILPESIAHRILEGETPIADLLPQVGVLFADIVSFTPMTTRCSPHEVVGFLNRIYIWLEDLGNTFGLEKIKTIGDCVLMASGLTEGEEDHLERLARFALKVQSKVGDFPRPDGQPLQLHIGIHAGPVVAGVIGKRKLRYDLWGETVNFAARLQGIAEPGAILTSEAFRQAVSSSFAFTPAGQQTIKGLGSQSVFNLQYHPDLLP